MENMSMIQWRLMKLEQSKRLPSNGAKERTRKLPSWFIRGPPFEANMLLMRTFWITPCLDSQVLTLKWKSRTKVSMSWCLLCLEHHHRIAKDNRRCYRLDHRSGFNLDHDLFHRVHQTGLLWVILVHPPCVRHLLYQSGYPWGRVSP